MKPKYIVFEGINGCGKGTQINLFENLLYDSSREVFVSRIRTPNALDENGKKAREMLGRDGNPYENAKEAVSYFGMNHRTTAEHIERLHHLGHEVISDRNYLSTFAFQHAQGVSYEVIAKEISGSKIPDLTFLIDVSTEVAFDRLVKRDGETRRKFDRDSDFLEKVRLNYLELPRILPDLTGDKSVVVINGNQDVEGVFEDIKNVYLSAFKHS